MGWKTAPSRCWSRFLPSDDSEVSPTGYRVDGSRRFRPTPGPEMAGGEDWVTLVVGRTRVVAGFSDDLGAGA